ncbi:MAG: hypothetical protein ACT4N9_06795 [Paracoccaceae bacterium]
MSAVEIEDVLSSIRRLVSEELRPLNRSTPRERPGSRLVLTPALRVPSRVPEMDAPPAPQVDPAMQGDDAAEGPPAQEAALRDLVRDLIREELQGTLGERITRNVRKLVRAEIARAMSMRDLD